MTPTPDVQAALRRSPATLLGGAILTVIAMGIGLFGVTVLAQTGRPTFQAHQTVNHVTFNAVLNNPTHGDERNFVLIRQAGGGEFVDEMKLQPGAEYEVYNYYHNNATPALRATDVRFTVTLPQVVMPGAAGSIMASISSPDAQPVTVDDTVTVTSDHAVQVALVSDSAVVHSNGAVNGKTLPDSIVGHGALLGFERFDGVIPGGMEHAGYVMYHIAVTRADCATTTCATAVAELPRTGPAGMVPMVFGGVLLMASVTYYLLSRRALQQSLLHESMPDDEPVPPTV